MTGREVSGCYDGHYDGRVAALPRDFDWTAFTGQFFLAITRDDGTEDTAVPEIAADGSYSYLVPDGVASVAGYRYVRPGDTVSGKFEIADV